MIQDYFSLDHRDHRYYILRVINKVDFAEEVVWASDFNVKEPKVLRNISEKILAYLIGGFDSLDKWKGDREGFHESIKHFGFEPVIKSSSLVPQFLTYQGGDPFLDVFFPLLKKQEQKLAPVFLPTKVGLLYDALLKLSVISFKPKDREADVPVPLEDVFKGNLGKISALLENFS